MNQIFGGNVQYNFDGMFTLDHKVVHVPQFDTDIHLKARIVFARAKETRYATSGSPVVHVDILAYGDKEIFGDKGCYPPQCRNSFIYRPSAPEGNYLFFHFGGLVEKWTDLTFNEFLDGQIRLNIPCLAAEVRDAIVDYVVTFNCKNYEEIRKNSVVMEKFNALRVGSLEQILDRNKPIPFANENPGEQHSSFFIVLPNLIDHLGLEEEKEPRTFVTLNQLQLNSLVTAILEGMNPPIQR